MRTIKRPVVVSIVCIIGFIQVVFSFPGVFSPSVKRLGDFYPALYGIVITLNFIAYIGTWHMKRWGVILLISAFFIKQLINIVTNDYGVYTIIGILTGVTCITILCFFYKQMDVDL